MSDVITAYTLRTFPELHKLIKSFADGKLNLCIIIGHKGQSKTTTIAKAMGNECLHIKGGNLTAFQLYQMLYHHRNLPVVIDDVDAIYTKRDVVGLLKALCQTEKEKTVSWHSSSHQLEKNEIPTSFRTSSKVCIIANQWKTLNADIEALEDRGLLVHFKPPARLILQEGKKWFKDKEILKYIEEQLPWIYELSMRRLVNAQQAKSAGLDWKRILEANFNIVSIKAIDQLRKKAKQGMSLESMIPEYQKITTFGRTTFFQHSKILDELKAEQAFKVVSYDNKKKGQGKPNGKVAG